MGGRRSCGPRRGAVGLEPLEVDNWLGVWFILPCVVGVCEVTFCCDGAVDRAGWYCELGGHALYDVALNLVFLGLQYVNPGESVASRTRSKKSA